MAKKIIKIVLLALLGAALIYSIVIEIEFTIFLSTIYNFFNKYMLKKYLLLIALFCSLCLVIVNIVIILKYGGIKEGIAYFHKDYKEEKIKKLREKLEKLER